MLSGCHIAITGTLSRVRDDIIKEIVAKGGTFSKTVTGSTTHLIAANPYLSTVKFSKAREMGVEIVDEDFLKTGKTAQIFGEADAIAREEDEEKRVTYEYLENGMWKPYADDAHGIVEAAFQDWCKDSTIDSRPIKSGLYIYKILFGASPTQTNMQIPPHTVRQIRRMVGGVETSMELPKANPAKKAAPAPAAKAKAKAAAPKRGRGKKSDIEDVEDEEEEEEEEKEDAKPKKRATRSASAKKAAPATATKKAKAKSKKGGALFEGMVFAISGKLSEPRAHYEKLINDNGGTLSKSVTKAVTHVIAPESESDSAKLQKARASGVLILTEEFISDAVADNEVPTKLDAYKIE